VAQTLLTEGWTPMIRNTNIVKIVGWVYFLAFSALVAMAQEESASQSFPGIKPQELKKMIDSKAADILVVSNDPQESYEEGHIPGAVSYPWVDTLKAPISLPRNKTLILYCSCAHEEDSSDMASKLARFGYHNIKLLEGGFLKWSELKYPIDKRK
jgi:rhodanese-related sulfurtransferase